MSGALQLLDPGVAAIRSAVHGTDDVDELASIHARMKAARELAKIHENTVRIMRDLFEIECLTLRKIARLDGLSTLRAPHRACAEWLGSLSSDEFDDFLSEARAETAISAYRQAMKIKKNTAAWENGRDLEFGTGNEIPESLHFEALMDRAFLLDLVSHVSDDYRDDEKPVAFSIAEVADQALRRHGLGNTTVSRSFRRGVEEAVREAIRKAPSISMDGYNAPRFVTCLSPHGGFIRVPFEMSTKAQLREMVAMKREQLQQDKAALDALAELLEFAEVQCADFELLGKLLDGRVTA